MNFDIRLPVGLLFLAIGLLVAGTGLFGGQAAQNAAENGVNIDLIWGAVMTAFALFMLLLTRIHRAPPE
jgi:steroid 5-alpha reductase family enzyme